MSLESAISLRRSLFSQIGEYNGIDVTRKGASS